MNGLSRHPGTEELAEFHAGVTHGARGDQLAAHVAECPECTSVSERLGQIPVMLASIPRPAMPADVETRITNALAAEVHAPASAGNAAWRRQSLTAPIGVLVAAAACLVLAFIGLRLSGQGHPDAGAGAGNGRVHAGGNASPGGVAGPRQNSGNPASSQRPGTFPVLVSPTNFRRPTLEAQVLAQLAAQTGGSTPQASPDSSASRPASIQVSPPKTLVGCVARLVGSARPALVEEATYQSRPAYVVAIPTHAWVVARDCTSASPAVLASVPLSTNR